MRGWIAKAAGLAGFALAASCAPAPQQSGPLLAPLDRGGGTIRLADLAKTDGASSSVLPPQDRVDARREARDPRGAARIALVWRSDCAPCIAELHYFDRLERAAGTGRLVTIALEPADQARATLARLRVKNHPAYAAVGDPQAFLEAVSGARRLPLAIGLDRNGAVCARHVGLLGVERARAWSVRC